LFIGDPGATFFGIRAKDFHKERKKEQKRKKGSEREGLWKPLQPWKSIKVAFGDILFDDFHRCLENPAGFSTVTTSPAAVHF
jgi:hypothetical protein